MTISLYIIYLGRVYVLRLAYTWLRPRMHAPLYKSKHIVKVIKNKIFFYELVLKRTYGRFGTNVDQLKTLVN